MGIYVDIQTRSNRLRAYYGFKVFSLLYRSLIGRKLFKPGDIKIWKGYPYPEVGQIIAQPANLASINHEHLIEEKVTDYHWGSRTTYLNYSLEVMGHFLFELEGEIKEIPGVMLFTGEEARLDLPAIYIETFTTYQKDFPDFLRGENNSNQERLKNCLKRVYEQLDEGKNLISFFLGENFNCVKNLHDAHLIIIDSKNRFFKKFLDYVIDLSKYHTTDFGELNWLTTKREEIIQMYNRMVYLTKPFLQNLINKIPIDEEKAATGFLEDYMKQYTSIEAGSYLIIDDDFSGKGFRRMLNDLVYKFSAVFRDSIDEKKDVEDKFVSVFKDSLKKWE